jgi:hypothetical protein
MLGYFTKKRTGGLISYYGLDDWWLTTFTEDERRRIIATFQPLGASSDDSITSGEVTYTSQSAPAFLSNLAGWFSKQPERSIARRLLAKAEQLATPEAPILDRHFSYQAMIEHFYRDREEPGCLEREIEACRQQISVAPQAAQAFKKEYKGSILPGHKGYQQLAIILEKQSRFQEVIDLCAQAAQQGWAGDWEGRIARSTKEMAKAATYSACSSSMSSSSSGGSPLIPKNSSANPRRSTLTNV